MRKAESAARGVGRTMKQSADVTEAEESVESLQAQQAQLEQELQAETTAAQAKSDPLTETFEIVSLRPKKADIAVRRPPSPGSRNGKTAAARRNRPGNNVRRAGFKSRVRP